MFKFISKLQKKSDADKKRIALATSGITTFIIAGVWITASLSNPDQVVVQGKEVSETQTATPFSALAKDFKSGFDSIGKGLSEINKTFKKLPEEFAALEQATSSQGQYVDGEISTTTKSDFSQKTELDGLEIIQVLSDEENYIQEYFELENASGE